MKTTTDIVAGMEAGARSHLKIIRFPRTHHPRGDPSSPDRRHLPLGGLLRYYYPRRGTARLPHRGIGDRTPGGRTVAEGQKGLAWCPSPMPRSTRFGVSRSVTPSTGSRSTSLVGDRRVLAWSSWMRTCTTLWPWVLPSTRAWRDGSRRGSSWARAGRPGARPALRTAAWRRSSTWNASSRCSSTGYAPHPRSRLRSTSAKQARRAAQLTIIPIRDHGIGKHTK
jgi:hypothetical protein